MIWLIFCAFKVLPVIDYAEKRIRELKILPDFINISWTSYDDKWENELKIALYLKKIKF